MADKLVASTSRASRKSGNEKFHEGGAELPFTIFEFWQWFASDLVNNTMRGFVAEFIVAKALAAQIDVRQAWASYDLRAPSGLKVEVKSAA